MKQKIITGKTSSFAEEPVKKKWLLSALANAAIFIITGMIGTIIFTSSAKAQSLTQLPFLPPDSSIIYMDYRNNWPNYISVSTDAMIHPDAEGIKNVSLSVYNQTDKLLDEVKIKVDYITSNGKTYKSEVVILNKIGPNSTKAVTAPDSDKGICVKMQIVSIRAAAFHFCYNFETKTGNNVDPYLCN